MLANLRLPLVLVAILAAILLVLSTAVDAAGPVRDGSVRAELVSESDSWKPGTTQWVGLRLQMDPPWHTYWQNPGDSGLPTEVTFTAPPGFQVGPLNWPYPLRTELAGLVSLGYEDTVLLPVQVQVPAGVAVGQRLALKAEARWLACAETCVPGQASLELTLPVATEVRPGPLAGEFQATRERLPQVDPGLRVEARVEGQKVVLDLNLPSGRQVGEALEFYPTQGTWLDLAAPQVLTRTRSGHRLELRRAAVDPRPPGALQGILVRPGSGGWALSLEVPVGSAAASGPPAPAVPVRSSLGEVNSLGPALVFAFLGGLILNLMPCVFPVVSLKVMGFLEHGGQGRAQGLKQALVFAAGVLGSFWLVAGALLALRAGGQHLGWGFQLQSPLFVALMASLFFGIALNLLGVFEVGLSLTRLGQVGSTGSGTWNSFLSGVLATLVATPCTAPYMGSALGFSLTQPAWVSLLVFTTLALGMASPYVILAAWPALLKRLPRPGAWMETFKQTLAFPLLLTVVFFVWVLDRQAGPQSVAALLTGLVLLGMAGWLHGRWALSGRSLPRVLAALCLLAGLGVAGFGAASLAATPADTQNEGAWEAWSAQRVESLLAQGRPVFLDFTASWCLTCQANKQVALGRPEVVQAFRQRGVVTLKADWTNRDEAITRALTSFGRSGVPLYVLYSGRPGDPPRILPEVLTPGVVLEALAELPTSSAQRRENP